MSVNIERINCISDCPCTCMFNSVYTHPIKSCTCDHKNNIIIKQILNQG